MKILAAVSEGVGSTVTAYKLGQTGYEVIGCYMKLHGKSGYHEENIAEVEKVTKSLRIPYHILDLQKDFKTKVHTPFINTYKEGRTPNPCALYSRFIKLGRLLEFTKSLGCEKLTTGHYARLENGCIKVTVDESEDQSYFLANANKKALRYLIFPLGEMKKEDVKKLVSTIEVLKSFATQKESSEVCFIGNTYVDVLEQFVDTKIKGEVLDNSGKVVGEHNGCMHYAIGKRRGFEMRGAHESHFVLKINPREDQIVIGTKEELKAREFKLENVNLFTGKKALNYEAKIRYRSKSMSCEVLVDENLNTQISLKELVYGLASGQMAVFYEEDRVMASGFIS